MKPPLATAAWAFATVLLAGLTAFLVARSTGKHEASASGVKGVDRMRVHSSRYPAGADRTKKPLAAPA